MTVPVAEFFPSLLLADPGLAAIDPLRSSLAIDPFLSASTTAELIERLERRLTLLGAAVALVVEGLILYAVWRFRTNDDPAPTETNHFLELAWMAATVAILAAVGLAAANALAHPALTGGSGVDAPGVDAGGPGTNGGGSSGVDRGPGPDDLEVIVEAERFEFSFTYAGETVRTRDELVLPADRTVFLTVTSADVLHSFHVPDLGIKRMAIPGEENAVRTTPTEPGEYRGYCAEYCGHGHSEMRFTVRVVERDEFEDWLEENRG